MNWLIIVIVVALVLGPIAYVMPSPREKRQGKLRERALAMGVQVKFVSYHKLNPEAAERVSAGGEVKTPKMQSIAYRVAHEIPAVQGPAEVVLVRIPNDAGVAYETAFEGWAVDRDAVANWPEFAARVDITMLQQELNKLPQEVQAYAADERFVACYWQENVAADSPVVDQIGASLQRLAENLRTQLMD